MNYDPDSNTFWGAPRNCEGLPQVMWHITNVCPLKCEYCFSPKTPEDFASKYATDVVKKLGAIGVQKIDIGGGEPLGSPALESVIRAIAKSKIYCTVTTSGVGRSSNIQYVTSNLQQLTRLIVSLDGYDSLHDKLRKYAGAWQSAISLLRSVPVEERRKRVRVNTVVTRPLLEAGGLSQLIPTISDLSVREWCLIQPHPANRKENYDAYAISDLEFRKALNSIRNMCDSKLQILHRTARLYSDYWVLQPSGVLQKHSTTEVDHPGISLLDSSIDDILEVVRTSSISVPLRTKSMILVSAMDSSDATSNLLADIADGVKQLNYGSVSVTKEPIPDTKGDFVVQILIDIGKDVAIGVVSEYIVGMINRQIEAARMRGVEPPKVNVSDDVQ